MDGRKKWLAVVELVAVFLITTAAFITGKEIALAERGYVAFGGEYCFFLIPVIYYIAKSMR